MFFICFLPFRRGSIFEKQGSRLEQGIDKLVDIYTRGYITKEKFDSKIEEMYQSLKAIKKQKEKTLDQKKLQQELDLITSSIQHFSSSVQSELDLEDWQDKRDIIKKLIQYIKIDLDDVYIVWQVKELAQEMQNKNMQHCQRTAVSATCMTPFFALSPSKLQHSHNHVSRKSYSS